MKNTYHLFVAICIWGIFSFFSPSLIAQQSGLPQIELSAGMYRIEAELAHTPASRQIGLMQRTGMPDNHGMLFIFPAQDRHCMWMRNTLIPLSVAFMDENGNILNIEHMQPQTENSHCAIAFARYALEMNRGWFDTHGIKAGMMIKGLDKLPAPN